MTPKFPVIELFDRLAVAQVKWNKTKANHAELAWYSSQVHAHDLQLVQTLFDELKNIHYKIWELEFDLKTGQEQHLSLDEIGRRALAVRDWNAKRITCKNKIAELLECPVREIKKDHLSQ